jgi:hypothetical protein
MLTKQAASDICDFLAYVAVAATREKAAIDYTDPRATTAIGGGIGGLVGLLGELRKKKRDRRYLQGILGGTLAGGGLGLGAGLLPAALSGIRGESAAPQKTKAVLPNATAGQQGGAPPPNAAAGQQGGSPPPPNAATGPLGDFITSRRLENDILAGLGTAASLSKPVRSLPTYAGHALKNTLLRPGVDSTLKKYFSSGAALPPGVTPMLGAGPEHWPFAQTEVLNPKTGLPVTSRSGEGRLRPLNAQETIERIAQNPNVTYKDVMRQAPEFASRMRDYSNTINAAARANKLTDALAKKKPLGVKGSILAAILGGVGANKVQSYFMDQ